MSLAPDVPAVTSAVAAVDAADLERRFGGLKRLYGARGYARVRAARVAVVGLGGVGSWAVEALARRIADIHPGCVVHCIEEFADADNWPGLLPIEIDAVIDACDQSKAKLALAAWARRSGAAFVTCGAAGGKRHAEKIEIEDLHATTHDPLLASLRQRLRSQHGAPRTGKIGVRCVFSRESVAPPEPEEAACEIGDDGDATTSADTRRDNTLNCHGYGSTVVVTASFGMAAAGEIVTQLLK